ncbi:MAG: hypothetical protein ACRC2M_21835, partial [Planktothrix sp.]
MAATAIASLSGFIVSSVTVTTPGSGYTSAPTVTISQPNAQAASAFSSVTNGAVSSISISDPGSGYISVPTVSVDPPNGSAASITVNYLNGYVNSVNIVNPGGGYVAPPTLTAAQPLGLAATAVAQLLGGSISGITVLTGGEGYTKIPKVTITPPVVQQATATITTDAGKISGYTIITPGKGYTSAPVVTVSSPNSVRAEGYANVTGDSISSITVTNTGKGYNSIPVISIDPSPYAGQVTGLPGPVGNLILTNPGLFFPRLTPPTITIEGDGEGANAIAHMDPGGSGAIDYIEIIDMGIGYTYADIIIEAPPESGNGEITGVNIITEGAGYDKVPTVTVTDPFGVGAVLQANILDGGVVSINVVSEGTGYEDPTISISAPTNTKPSLNYAVGFSYSSTADGYNIYQLLKLDGTQISSDEIDNYSNFTKLLLFKTVRFLQVSDIPLPGSYIVDGDKVWCDGYNLSNDTLK